MRPENRQAFIAHVEGRRENRLKTTAEREAFVAERKQKLRAAYQALLAGNPEPFRLVISNIAAYRINTDVMPDMMGAAFFSMEMLGDDEFPEILATHRQEHTCDYIGESGGTAKTQNINYKVPTKIDLRIVATPLLEYPTRTLYSGNLSLLAEKQRELQEDLTIKHDVDMVTLLEANDVASGLRATRNFHSTVVQANYPDTNRIDDATAMFGVSHLRSFADYCVRWGLRPTAVFVSPMALSKGLWQQVDIVSGIAATGVTDPADTVPTYLRDQIWQTGAARISMYGFDFDIVPNNRLTDGTAWGATTQAAGFWWRRPSGTLVVIDNDAELQMENLARVGIKEEEAMAIRPSQRTNFVKITHNT